MQRQKVKKRNKKSKQLAEFVKEKYSMTEDHRQNLPLQPRGWKMEWLEFLLSQ